MEANWRFRPHAHTSRPLGFRCVARDLTSACDGCIWDTTDLFSPPRFFLPPQGPKVQQKTKEQKLAAALAGSRQKKKKWNKGKMREKMNSKVLFDEDGWLRLQAEVPKMKVVTPSALVERLKINGSLARAACKFLESEGKITAIETHNKQRIYTRITNA